MNKQQLNREQSKHLARIVLHKYKNELGESVKKTVQFFKMEGCSETTIRRYLKKYRESGDIDFKIPPGRPAEKAPPKVVEKIKKIFDKNPSETISSVASRVNLSRSYTNNIKLRKLGIKVYTKKPAAKRSQVQEIKVIERLPKLYKKILRKKS